MVKWFFLFFDNLKLCFLLKNEMMIEIGCIYMIWNEKVKIVRWVIMWNWCICGEICYVKEYWYGVLFFMCDKWNGII